VTGDPAAARLEGRVAIVTGGAEGIGRGIAEVLAERGAAVGILDINAERGAATARAIASETGAATVFAHCDVGVEPAVQRAVGDVFDALGPPTILVNNAALFLFRGIEATPEEWAQILAVNIVGPALLAKHVVPHMREAGGGAIVNIGSVSSFIAQKGFLTYSATKGAVAEMTRCMALDLVDDGVRVNGVCPGTVWSATVQRMADDAGLTREELVSRPNLGLEQMIKRIADPREIGYAVAFLASSEAAFITGENLMVDGGWTAR
jgi:dihydroanticapsin dehydrogenase